MWEKELKIIDSLGKLYPEFEIGTAIKLLYIHFSESNETKSWWLCELCSCHLKQRLPYLEEFMKNHIHGTYINVWEYYKFYFNITDEQCGKKN